MRTDSAIYWGRVTHQRFLPRVHHFRYRVMMFHLLLDELDERALALAPLRLEGRVTSHEYDRRLANIAPGRFTLRRSDFLPQYPGTLEEAARAMYRDLSGAEAPGRVGMLANLRSLGWNFNPITVFFFYEGERVVAAVAEVTNTPWHERHLYWLGPVGTVVFAKAHHVSPFLEMDGTYRLTYGEPGEHFSLAMTLFDLVERVPLTLGARRFSATMRLERRPLTRRTLRRAQWRYPDSAWRVTLRIYLQAAALFAKRVRYVPHPHLKGPDRVDH